MTRTISIVIGGSPPQDVSLTLSTDFGFDTGSEVSGPVNPVSLEFFQPLSMGSSVVSSSGSVLNQQWVDERVATLIEDDSLFSFSNGVLVTTNEETNIVSHFVGPQLAAGDPSQWSAYEFTGEFLREDPLGGIGVTFHSQHPGTSGYYRVRMFVPTFTGYEFEDRLHITGDTGATWTGNRDLGIVPAANVWYSFRILIELSGGVRIRARVWPTGDAEPGTWQADATDTASLYTQGTVGAWCMASGAKRWRNFTVNESGSVESLPMVLPLTLSIGSDAPGFISGATGETVQLSATLTGGELSAPQDVTSQTTWTSSSPAHLTIDTDGLGTAHDPGTSETVTVTGQHLELQDSLQILVTTGSGSGGEMLATINDRGVTFSMDQPYEYGCHLDGSPYIVVGVGGSAKLIGLPHRDIGSDRNGGCLDQFCTLEYAETRDGGDTGSRYEDQRSQGFTSRVAGYDAALNDTKNVNPSNPSTWLTITPQFTCTGAHAGKYSQLVVSVDAIQSTGGTTQSPYHGSYTMAYGILTVYELTPPANMFRPGIERGDRECFVASDIDYNVLAGVPQVAGAPSTVTFGSSDLAELGTYFLRSPWFPLRYDTTRRGLHPVTSTGGGFTTQSSIPTLGNAMLWANSNQFNVLDEEHRKIFYRLVQAGIDADSIRTESGNQGGHQGGTLHLAVFARKLLGLGAHSKGVTWNETSITFYVRSTDSSIYGDDASPRYVPLSRYEDMPEYAGNYRFSPTVIYRGPWWSDPPTQTCTGSGSGTSITLSGLTANATYEEGYRLNLGGTRYVSSGDVTTNGSGVGVFTTTASFGSYSGSVTVEANAILWNSYRTTNCTREGLGMLLALGLMGVTRAEWHGGAMSWLDPGKTAADVVWDYMERFHTLETGASAGAYQRAMWERYRDSLCPTFEHFTKWGKRFTLTDSGNTAASTKMAIEGQGRVVDGQTQITAGTTIGLYSVSVVPDSPTYLWEVNRDGTGWSSVGSSKDITYNFPTAGTYDVRLTVSGLTQTRTSAVIAS